MAMETCNQQPLLVLGVHGVVGFIDVSVPFFTVDAIVLYCRCSTCMRFDSNTIIYT